MRNLHLSKKTGFDIVDPYTPVNIRDYRGILFYTTEPLLPRVEHFNLPAGDYIVDSGSFRQRIFPNDFKKSVLPFPQRFYPSTDNFNVRFANNPNKCTVSWANKEIVFDNAFREKPLPQIDFILFHEEGHERYKTEKYADLYAANRMIDKGYNDSQIGLAPVNTLSDAAYERKDYIVNRIINRNRQNAKR